MFNSLARWNLRGPVRSMRSEFAEWDIGEEHWGASRRSTIVHFRPDGSVDEQVDHNPNGSVSKQTYIYDEAGRLLIARFQLNDAPAGERVYRYDSQGRLSRTFSLDEKGVELELETYSYDSAGFKTKLQSVPKFESVACGVTYGVEGAEQSYTAQGVAKIVTSYDEREQPSEALFYDADQHVVLRVMLERDAAGRLLSEQAQFGDLSPFQMFGSDLPPETPAEEREAIAATIQQLFGARKTWAKTSYRYDDRGRRVECVRSLTDVHEERTTSQHDDNDNPALQITEGISRELRHDASGNLQPLDQTSSRREVRFDYKYDPQGNWTERVVSVRLEVNPEFQRSNIERRVIEYYG
jgi:hypothetical protein